MSDSSQRQKVWDVPVRLFHWLLVALVLVLWLSGEFGGFNVTASLPLVGDVYLANMDIHALAGQGVFVLVVFRVLWGIWGSTTARFGHFLGTPAAVAREARDLLKGRLRHSTGHNPLGGVMVVALLLLLLIQSVSGMLSADDLFYQGPLTHLVAEETMDTASWVHHEVFAILQVLIILHVLAVLYYLVRGKNLIGAMFSGAKKQVGDGVEPLTFSPWWLAILSALLALGVLLLLLSL